MNTNSYIVLDKFTINNEAMSINLPTGTYRVLVYGDSYAKFRDPLSLSVEEMHLDLLGAESWSRMTDNITVTKVLIFFLGRESKK